MSILLLLLVHQALTQTDPSTFWNDYSDECERSCHQTVWANQACSMSNASGCKGCLCLADSCLCVTDSWLTAVSQRIGLNCGSSAVSEAAGIALQGCNSYNMAMSMSEQDIISVGLAAIRSSPSSTAALATSSAVIPATSAVSNSFTTSTSDASLPSSSAASSSTTAASNLSMSTDSAAVSSTASASSAIPTQSSSGDATDTAQSGSLDEGDKIALGIGIGSGIPMAVGVIVTIYLNFPKVQKKLGMD